MVSPGSSPGIGIVDRVVGLHDGGHLVVLAVPERRDDQHAGDEGDDCRGDGAESDPPASPADRHDGGERGVDGRRSRWIGRHLRGVSDGVEDPRPQPRRWRLGNGIGHRRRGGAHRVELGTEFGPPLEGGVQVALLHVGERADSGERHQLAQLVVGHRSTPIAVRNRMSPSRIRVFTVPRATPRWSAICTWVMPS